MATRGAPRRNHAVEEAETETAVSLAVITEPKPPEPGVGYTLQGVLHHVTAWLRQSLNGRVFVGLHVEGHRGGPRLRALRSEKRDPTSDR